MRNRMARFASRASSDYHTYLFFKVSFNLLKIIFIVNLGKKNYRRCYDYWYLIKRIFSNSCEIWPGELYQI